MPLRTAIWKVGKNPQQLNDAALSKEQILEEMIVANHNLLFEEWMLIGQQAHTGGGRIDLLGIDPVGTLILIELKRNRTPREVVAQALDYASWVEKLQAKDIAEIYRRFKKNGDLAIDFKKRFGHALDEDSLNQNHQIVIVEASLDDSSERIVTYLSKRNIPVNVLFFQVFAHGSEQLLSRTWLFDPARAQINATVTASDGQNEPWNGEFYSSFGHGASRSWDDAMKYGFICAGGGSWYSNTLKLLNTGDRIWVNVPGTGYVGVGKVIDQAEPATTFKVENAKGDKIPILDIVEGGDYHREYVNDPERCEYFVRVDWLQTVPLKKAVKEVGLFGNQNSVCRPTKPKWRTTVERLKKRFVNYDKPSVVDLL